MANIEWKSEEDLQREAEQAQLENTVLNQEERIKALENTLMELMEFL